MELWNIFLEVYHVTNIYWEPLSVIQSIVCINIGSIVVRLSIYSDQFPDLFARIELTQQCLSSSEVYAPKLQNLRILGRNRVEQLHLCNQSLSCLCKFLIGVPVR